MDDSKLVHQTNQIAAYFSAYPEARARAGVLEHILKFWPPAKRSELQAFVAGGGQGLHPLVEHAVEQLKAGATLES